MDTSCTRSPQVLTAFKSEQINHQKNPRDFTTPPRTGAAETKANSDMSHKILVGFKIWDPRFFIGNKNEIIRSYFQLGIKLSRYIPSYFPFLLAKPNQPREISWNIKGSFPYLALEKSTPQKFRNPEIHHGFPLSYLELSSPGLELSSPGHLMVG